MTTKRAANIIDVAKLAGVSKSTVSRVVSDRGGSVSGKSLNAVNAAIKKLGYTRNTFAASLRGSKTYLVLLMVPDIANPFWSEIARAVQDRFEGEQYSVVVGNTDWSEEREEAYFALARSGRFDGLIVNSVTDDMSAFKRLGIPLVMVGERAEGCELDTVGTDTHNATLTALEYLYNRGHRAIAIATSESGSERYLSRRHRAYKAFHKAKHLAVDPALAFSVRLSEEGGRDLVKRILALPGWQNRMSAIFCGNDTLAITAINALRVAGVEPGKDLSIIGMDDIPAAALTYPGLTTIRKQRSAIGRMSAELLMKRLGDPTRPPEKHLFPGELVVRDSVGELRTKR